MENLTLKMFFDSWELFRESALAGAVAGSVLGFLGVYIIARKMVFFSAALSQTAGLGVTLAFYVQIHLHLGGFFTEPLNAAMLSAFILVAIIMADSSEDGYSRDRFLGLAFLVGSAGMLVVGTRILQEIQDIQTLIFGSAVAVLPEDFKLLVTIFIVIAAVHLVLWRGFISVTLDRADASIRKLPTFSLELCLLILLAVGISVCTRILGALPAFAFSVLPAMAAVRLVSNMQRALIVAAIIGGVTGFMGYLFSYLYEFPVGPSQVLVGVGFVVVAEGISLLRNRIPALLSRLFTHTTVALVLVLFSSCYVKPQKKEISEPSISAFTPEQVEAFIATEIKGYKKRSGKIQRNTLTLVYDSTESLSDKVNSKVSPMVTVIISGECLGCTKMDLELWQQKQEELKKLRLSRAAKENPELVFEISEFELGNKTGIAIYMLGFTTSGRRTIKTHKLEVNYNNGINQIKLIVQGFGCPAASVGMLERCFPRREMERVAKEVFKSFSASFVAE